jgi:hypothetical protein
MWRECLSCGASLGSRRRTGGLPPALSAASRVAFDPDGERVWALCLRCDHWNLVPDDETVEDGLVAALDELVQTAPERSTVGAMTLARHDAGLEVVRLSGAGLPERTRPHGVREVLRRRRAAALLKAGPGAAVLVGIGAAGIAGMLQPHLTIVLLAGGGCVSDLVRRGRIEFAGRSLGVSLEDARGTWIARSPGPTGWVARIGGANGTPWLSGDEAEDLLGVVLRVLNRFGASRRRAETAWALARGHGSLDDLVGSELVIAGSQAAGAAFRPRDLPPVRRLALEIALHERVRARFDEDRAGRLAAGWAEAEELARIVDEL